MRILAPERVADEGLALLRSKHTVDEASKLSPQELLDRIGDYDALLVRSATKVTADVIQAGKRLRVIGRAGVGVDNIDLPAATRQGILVVNTPAGSTVAAAEHALGLMLALSRNISRADRSMKRGEWNRKAFMGSELRSKNVGVIGLGRIGSEVARLLSAMRADVIAFDPALPGDVAKRRGIELVDLDTLLARCDMITIHAPLVDQTRHLINAKNIAKMRDGVMIVNCARGGIVHTGDLDAALASGKVAGAALDVYETEPPEGVELIKRDNVIATPHIAASTKEAQRDIGVLLAQQVLDALDGRPVASAVNLPSLPPEVLAEAAPYVDLLAGLTQVVSRLAQPPLSQIEIGFSREVPPEAEPYLAQQAVAGILAPFFEAGGITVVNAGDVARERGIEVKHGQVSSVRGRQSLVTLAVTTPEGRSHVKGTADGMRILEVNDFLIDLVPRGNMLMTIHHDQPGVVAKVATEFADRQINISEMHLARTDAGGTAMMLVGVDCPLEEDVVASISKISGMKHAFCLCF